MEYYSLTALEYIKYYIMGIYYTWIDYPPVIRLCSLVLNIAVIYIVLSLLKNYIRAVKEARHNRRQKHYTELYEDKMEKVALSPNKMDPNEIAQAIELPADYKMNVKKTSLFVPILRDLYHKIEDDENFNRSNWRNLTIALRMPTYFEKQMQSRVLKKRLAALKNITDDNTDLKEAVASRYLYARDEKLRMSSRLHVARYGTSYPFKIFTEDTKGYVSEELMVKLHNVFVYRLKNNLSIPNLVRWCNLYPINEELRLFAVNEIRLLQSKKDCPELLDLLKDSKDEKFSLAIIRCLGELRYRKAEPELLRRYNYAAAAERGVIAEALGNIKSGNPEVIDFYVKDFKETTRAATKVRLLRNLYDYGSAGRAAYELLKKEAKEDDIRFFDHVECEYIDSRKYA